MRTGGNLSVFKHDYRAYTGPVTPLWSRVLVLARYGLSEIWSSKITIGLFTLSMLPSIVLLVVVYLANSRVARMLVMRGSGPGPNINAAFFLVMLEVPCWAALVLNAWIAPRLITFDLS